jgi:hypothetical protein
MYREDGLLSTQKGHLSKSEDGEEPDVFGNAYEKLN